jgi:hypothetical protein
MASMEALDVILSSAIANDSSKSSSTSNFDRYRQWTTQKLGTASLDSSAQTWARSFKQALLDGGGEEGGEPQSAPAVMLKQLPTELESFRQWLTAAISSANFAELVKREQQERLVLRSLVVQTAATSPIASPPYGGICTR